MLQIPRVLRPIAVDCDKPKATKNSHYIEKDFYIVHSVNGAVTGGQLHQKAIGLKPQNIHYNEKEF